MSKTISITIGQYLDSLKEDIIHLDLSYKKLYHIPSLARFTRLRIVHLTGNNLKSLPEIPEGVHTINCGHNQLESIEGLPNSVVYLSALNNNIKHIHHLPTSLKSIDISGNSIHTIDSLPPLLEGLICESNDLDKFPEFPNTLLTIYCSDNPRLTTLPNIPPRLIALSCNRCGLIRLPKLPKSLCTLAVDQNPIGFMENFPIVLGTYGGVVFGNNPYFKMLKHNKPAGLTRSQTHEFYNRKINKLQRARELRHLLRLKDRLRAWLWERVRLPKVERANHPDLLARYRLPENEDNMDEVMNNFGIVNFGC